MITLCFIFLLSLRAHAVDVAFLEIHDRAGKPIQLEPGGRFMHVAIRVGNRWLQAHSQAGVELIEDLHEFGDRIVILRQPRIPEPSLYEYQEWLGKRFDFKYTWDDPQATYCTRLVADLLHVEAQVMEFKAEIWKKHIYRAFSLGKPGLSPDDLFKILLGRGYRPVLAECERRLEPAS
jgi:hypothetical protein